MNFGVLDNMAEDLSEGYVNFLGMDCNGVDKSADNLLVFGFVVPA